MLYSPHPSQAEKKETAASTRKCREVGEENRGRGEMVTEGRGKRDIGLREVRDQQGKEGNELLGREGDKANGEKGRRREENGMRNGKGDSKKRAEENWGT